MQLSYDVYIWLVTAVCLNIQTLLAYDRVLEKCFWGPGESWKFYVTKRVGTLQPTCHGSMLCQLIMSFLLSCSTLVFFAVCM